MLKALIPGLLLASDVHHDWERGTMAALLGIVIGTE